jgi:hypothetical protein
MRPARKATIRGGNMMFFLVYASSAVTPFLKSELVELLARSRKRNAHLKLTGMLLYKDGNFLQVLEGDEAAVRERYGAIVRDPRHRGHFVLLQGNQEERQFPDWSMGFRDISDEDVHSTPGYSEFMNVPLTKEGFATNPTRCQKLLLVFKKNM